MKNKRDHKLLKQRVGFLLDSNCRVVKLPQAGKGRTSGGSRVILVPAKSGSLTRAEIRKAVIEAAKKRKCPLEQIV